MRIKDEAGKNSCQIREALTSEIRNHSLFHMNKDSIMSKGLNEVFLRKGEIGSERHSYLSNDYLENEFHLQQKYIKYL